MKREDPSRDAGARVWLIKSFIMRSTGRPNLEKQVQWTLKQQGFELHRSTYSWIVFRSKYYRTTQFAVDRIPGCGTTDTEEMCIWKINYSSYMDIFVLCRESVPLTPVLFKGQLH